MVLPARLRQATAELCRPGAYSSEVELRLIRSLDGAGPSLSHAPTGPPSDSLSLGLLAMLPAPEDEDKRKKRVAGHPVLALAPAAAATIQLCFPRRRIEMDASRAEKARDTRD